MTDYIAEIRSILQKITIESNATWIAFSGGLDSSVLGHLKCQEGVEGITIIAEDFLGTDLTYSQISAKHIGMPLKLRYSKMDEILNAINETIKILKNFNDIEIRNSIVPYLYLNTLKEKNVKNVITGDGADEIFAGYNFLIKKNNEDILDELKRMKKIMHFTSQKIAHEFDMSIHMPFIDKEVIDFAEKLPIDFFVNQKDGIRFGKWILRKAFENDLPSNIIWREKTPMQDGSGTVGLTKLFESIITDDIFTKKIKKIKDQDGITIRTKESLHYYELYKKEFDIPIPGSSTTICADCKSEIVDNSKFCRMCGKFPLT